MIEPIAIAVKGPIDATTVVWSLSAQHRVTVIAKTCFCYDEHGSVRAVDAGPIIRSDIGLTRVPCDLAPFLRGVQVVLIGSARGDASDVAMTVQRGASRLLERSAGANDVAMLGPQRPDDPHGLARFGKSIVSLTAGTDGALFSSAPAEQRLPIFEGDETITLEGLDPRASRVVIPLPRFELKAGAKVGSLDVPFETRLDTIVLEPASHRVSLCWRGSFPIRADMLADLALSMELKLSAGSAKPDSRTTPMQAVNDEPLPFSPDAAKSPPPIANTLHGAAATGTVALRQRIPRQAATPFEPTASGAEDTGSRPPAGSDPAPASGGDSPFMGTAALSREELAKAVAAAAVPFEGAGASAPRQPSAPIPDAPWETSPQTPPTNVQAPRPGQSTVSMPFIKRNTEIVEPEEPAPPSPPPPPAAPPKAPEKKTADEIERERPKQAWASGPETGPIEPTAPSRPKRAPRKALNDLLYGKGKPKKK